MVPQPRTAPSMPVAHSHFIIIVISVVTLLATSESRAELDLASCKLSSTSIDLYS